MSTRDSRLPRGVVAVDGPSGSGKSTLSKAVARTRRWRYLDTGAMYRAVALAVLEKGADPSDPAAVEVVARGLELEPGTDPDAPSLTLNGVDVSAAVRTPEVTAAVSLVAAVPAVRALLVEQQRALASEGGIVVEGRDIGSVVLPDASLKVWLTADPDERARRRSAEYVAAGVATDAEREQGALARRDALDAGRATSPALPAPDAVVLDSTSHSVEELLALVLAELDSRDPA
jgi:cytidylate kinase